MELWQLDVMGGIWLTDGREVKAVTGIDDHSRFCVAAGLVERANARAVCRVFTQALARYGTPEELLTDNGKVFTGWLGPTPARCCSTASAANAASPTGSPASAPTTTGKIERSTTPTSSWMPGWPTPTSTALTRPSPETKAGQAVLSQEQRDDCRRSLWSGMVATGLGRRRLLVSGWDGATGGIRRGS